MAEMDTGRARSRSPRRKAGAVAEVPEELKAIRAHVVNLDRRTDRWERVSALLKKEVPWLEFERLSASDGSKIEIPETEIATIWSTKCNAVYGDYDEWVYDAPGTPLDGTHWKWPCDLAPEDDDGVRQPLGEGGQDWKLVQSDDGDGSGTIEKLSTKETWKVKLAFAQRFLEPGETLVLSRGERGCAHSHRRIWQLAAERAAPTLALEDDASLVFTRSGDLGEFNGTLFTQRLTLALKELPQDFDVLYLGWSGWRGGHFKLLKEEDHGSAVRKVEYVWTTVAYVVSQAGAKKLLAAGSPVNQPVDNFMAWEASQGRLKSYVVVDEGDDDDTWCGGIVDQLDFAGDSDVQKSDGGIQGDDEKDYRAEPKQ